MKFNIEIYVNDKLSTVIPNLSEKKVAQYQKTLSIQNGYYKIVENKQC
jgi:hypothetical protein